MQNIPYGMVCLFKENMTSFSKEIWIKEGLDVIAESGASNLTIEGLTLRLRVTKGSFYHHFQSRLSFITEMLEYWENQMTSDIIKSSKVGRTFKEKNEKLISHLERTKNSELEIAIRAWSLHDALVQKFQERVDKRRIAYLKDLFFIMTEDNEKADIFSNIQYLYYIGNQQIGLHFSEEKFRYYTEALNNMFRVTIEK